MISELAAVLCDPMLLSCMCYVCTYGSHDNKEGEGFVSIAFGEASSSTLLRSDHSNVQEYLLVVWFSRGSYIRYHSSTYKFMVDFQNSWDACISVLLLHSLLCSALSLQFENPLPITS